MARIAYGRTDVPVDQRLVAAFWTLLEDAPFRRVTISKLTELASCNRASFYYHYEDSGDLLQKALERELVYEAGIMPSLAALAAGQEVGELNAGPRFELAFRQVDRQDMSEVLQRFFCKLWTVVLCHEGETLSDEAREAISFLADGMLGSYARSLARGCAGWGASSCSLISSCLVRLGALYDLSGFELSARLGVVERVWSSLD